MEIVLLAQKEEASFAFFRHNLPAVRLFASFPQNLENRVYIARKSEDIFLLPEGCTLIADAETPLPPMENRRIQVLTCGLSPKDTFTFSSREEDSAVISMMRAVTASAGVLEPMEIPIRFPPGTGNYPLLSATAALVLTGQLPFRMRKGRVFFTK